VETSFEQTKVDLEDKKEESRKLQAEMEKLESKYQEVLKKEKETREQYCVSEGKLMEAEIKRDFYFEKGREIKKL
jgi:hypothetical protein